MESTLLNWIQRGVLSLLLTRDKFFLDTSNTRYQSHSYAAAELLTFLDIYIDLLEISRDSKKQASFNHLEQNVAKRLEDISTLTEMAAIALYGNAVSWPYLNQVRGTGGTVVNLLDPVSLLYIDDFLISVVILLRILDLYWTRTLLLMAIFQRLHWTESHGWMGCSLCPFRF